MSERPAGQAPTMKIAVIGGGSAGLMAAEEAAAGGAQVELYDAMPSVGRKFLLAGRGGLNLTHSEPLEAFLSRYGTRRLTGSSWGIVPFALLTPYLNIYIILRGMLPPLANDGIDWRGTHYPLAELRKNPAIL